MAIIDDYADINRRMNFRAAPCVEQPAVKVVEIDGVYKRLEIPGDLECRPTSPLWLQKKKVGCWRGRS